MLSPPVLLFIATVIACISVTFPLKLHPIISPDSFVAELPLGYIPLLCGCVCMYICFKAWQRSIHRVAVILYSTALAPFAFSYPAWMVFIWIAYAYGGYQGPMP